MKRTFYAIHCTQGGEEIFSFGSKSERDSFCVRNTDHNVFAVGSRDEVVLEAKDKEGRQGSEPQIVHVTKDSALVGICDDGETACKVLFLGWPPEAAEIDHEMHGDNTDLMLAEYERKFSKPFFGSFTIRYDYEV